MNEGGYKEERKRVEGNTVKEGIIKDGGRQIIGDSSQQTTGRHTLSQPRHV